jgi:predicted RNA-binding Zn-ribbon protein involved in translation (DUF1610 family)
LDNAYFDFSLAAMEIVPRADGARKFAHILHFRCPNCGKRIKAVRANESMSREHIARLMFQPRCACGWSGQLAGFNAIQHAVECWNGQSADNSAAPDNPVEPRRKPAIRQRP